MAPAHFAGRHTPFAELKAKREAADTRLETEETPAGMPSLQHSVSCLKLSDGPQEPPHPHPRPRVRSRPPQGRLGALAALFKPRFTRALWPVVFM